MEHPEWGFLIVNYLFWAGVSAGAMAISGFATYLGGRRYRRVARIGAMVAPWPVAIGTGLLLLDLGRPLAFWHLFMTLQWTSPMSIGSWLLTFFILISLAYFVAWLPEPIRNLVRVPHRLGDVGRPAAWQPMTRRAVRMLRGGLAAAGFPFALGVGIYTGILLGAIPARPFWNTGFTAQLFLFSALSTGTALVLLLAVLFGRAIDPEGLSHERHLLVSVDAVLIVLEIFIIVPFFLHHALSTWSSARSIQLVMGGPFTALFWIGVVLVGLLIPLNIEGYELYPMILKEGAVRYSRLLGGLSAVLVLVGGFLLRYVFVYAGQTSHLLPLLAH